MTFLVTVDLFSIMAWYLFYELDTDFTHPFYEVTYKTHYFVTMLSENASRFIWVVICIFKPKGVFPVTLPYVKSDVKINVFLLQAVFAFALTMDFWLKYRMTPFRIYCIIILCVIQLSYLLWAYQNKE